MFFYDFFLWILVFTLFSQINSVLLVNFAFIILYIICIIYASIVTVVQMIVLEYYYLWGFVCQDPLHSYRNFYEFKTKYPLE